MDPLFTLILIKNTIFNELGSWKLVECMTWIHLKALWEAGPEVAMSRNKVEQKVSLKAF